MKNIAGVAARARSLMVACGRVCHGRRECRAYVSRGRPRSSLKVARPYIGFFFLNPFLCDVHVGVQNPM